MQSQRYNGGSNYGIHNYWTGNAQFGEFLKHPALSVASIEGRINLLTRPLADMRFNNSIRAVLEVEYTKDVDMVISASNPTVYGAPHYGIIFEIDED